MDPPPGFTLLQKFDGPRDKEKNWGYVATDPSGQPCTLLWCNPGQFVIINSENLELIHGSGTWYITKKGYPATSTIVNGKKAVITMHSFLMNRHNSNDEMVIDHINRNNLDNRLENLRLITKAERNTARAKCRRKREAVALPDGIKQAELPKYVVYYHEKCYPFNPQKPRYREFFRVETHPIQDAMTNDPFNTPYNAHGVKALWSSSKSSAHTIREKLEDARIYVKFLDEFLIINSKNTEN